MASEAGRELDEQIGRCVFGFWPMPHPDSGFACWWASSDNDLGRVYASAIFPHGAIWGPDQHGDGLPRFSTSMSAAWTVVEAMRARGWYIMLDAPDMPPTVPDNWHCFIDRRRTKHEPDDWIGGEGETPALAICRAALAALAAPS